MCCRLCSFRVHDMVTDYARQSYPDRVPDPGPGERYLDALGRVVLSSQRADESHLELYTSCTPITCAVCTGHFAGLKYV